jgi:lipopolysaccharide transport system ATP-binding protein
MKTAIRVQDLSKRYQIGGSDAAYRTLRETIMAMAAAPWKRLQRFARRGASNRSHEPDTIWALKDASFEVQPGEVVGIIGRNGAGKSTLLKMLARITEPTSGRIELRGRVGSLLEVGTGFHPELTGRENIFLDGAILGMTRREVIRKFDDIVAFAEVEQFLDTPVKHYSSGMYVRLAFAVAAHLEPEILFVDEVLAVGDLAFQKKCLNKMENVAHEGRTILFVSHDLGAISRLCPRTLHLHRGTVRFDGSTDRAIASYVRQLPPGDTVLHDEGLSLKIWFEETPGSPLETWSFDSDLTVNVEVRSERPLRDPAIDVTFYADNGARLFSLQSDRLTEALNDKKVSQFQLQFQVRNPGLACVQLTVDVGIRASKDPHYLAWWQRVAALPLFLGDGVPPAAPGALLSLPCRAELTKTSS